MAAFIPAQSQPAPTSGRVTQVQRTAHITAIIASIGLVIVMVIFAVALAGVILRDGNTNEVNNAMSIVGQIAMIVVVSTSAVAGVASTVSAYISRLIPGVQSTTQGASDAPPA